MPTFRPIDYENWNRREIYENYMGMQYGMTMQMDVTGLYRTMKREGRKFYSLIAWALTKTCLDDDAFRMMLRGGRIGVMDGVGTNFTVIRDCDPTLFAHGVCPFDEDIAVYCECFEDAKRKAEACGRLYFDAAASADCIDISVTPNLSFTGLACNIPPQFYAGKADGKFSPFTTVGRFYKEGDRVLLPVSANFHHCVNDGYHAGVYFRLLEENLRRFE